MSQAAGRVAPEAVWAGASGAQEAPQAQAQKNAARGDSDGVFHFIELPKGKDSFFDEATRRVGAERENGKHKKAPQRKSGGAVHDSQKEAQK